MTTGPKFGHTLLYGCVQTNRTRSHFRCGTVFPDASGVPETKRSSLNIRTLCKLLKSLHSCGVIICVIGRMVFKRAEGIAV